jgi:hypothetical protein
MTDLADEYGGFNSGVVVMTGGAIDSRGGWVTSLCNEVQ